MMRHVYVPSEGPPSERPNPDIYAKMGEENIFRMLADFYRELERSSVRHMFPEDMQEASRKSAMFFVFLLGGPALYQKEFGSPMMRQRHMPFVIDENARQVWLDCFKVILNMADKKYDFPQEHLDGFYRFLEQFSGWMVNTRTMVT